MTRHATRFNKRDANEQEIILALAKIGIATFEAGPLDFWMFVECWIPVEVKTLGGRLTEGQQSFVNLCDAQGWPYRIFRSADEAIASVQALKGL